MLRHTSPAALAAAAAAPTAAAKVPLPPGARAADHPDRRPGRGARRRAGSAPRPAAARWHMTTPSA